VRLGDGRVLVVGGSGDPGTETSAEIYDPATGSWSLTGSLHVGRTLHTTTLLADGRVLVTGGLSTGFNTTATAEIYDPATGLWTMIASMNAVRNHHTATLLPNGKVLVAGSYLPGTATCELYDPVSGTWTYTGSMANTRNDHRAALLPDGTVLVAAGKKTSEVATCEIYDVATGTWSTTGTLADARVAHTLTVLADGTALVAGGDAQFSPVLDSAEIYSSGATEGTHVSGSGAVPHGTGSATFNTDLTVGSKRPTGYFTFIDLTAGVSFSQSKIRTFTISGHTATIAGSAKLENRGGTVTFNVVLTDNSVDGSTDTFSITMSNGYSASGTLTAGNVTID
jgi:hypothetical protein